MLPAELTALIDDYGFSRASLARALGVSQQAVWSWENDVNTPGSHNLIIMLRLREMWKHRVTRAKAEAAVKQASRMGLPPEPGRSAVLAGQVSSCGLGFLLGELFSA